MFILGIVFKGILIVVLWVLVIFVSVYGIIKFIL